MPPKNVPHTEAQERVRIGATVRQLREARHVTLDELSRALGISRPYLSNIEAGRKPITPSLLGQIAEVLHVRAISIVSPDYFPATDLEPASS